MEATLIKVTLKIKHSLLLNNRPYNGESNMKWWIT